MRQLKTELEKKQAENEALRSNVDDLTKALTSLNIVKDKIVIEPEEEKPKKISKKDKDAPVPAKTAYKFYCDANAKQEGVDMRQVWKDLAPELRQVFLNMAEADKARFLRENSVYTEEKAALEVYYDKKKQDTAMEFYEAHLAAQAALEKVAAEKKGGKKATKKDPDQPKRPMSSYIYFANDKRESVVKKNPDMPVTEVSKVLGEMWSKLDKGGKGKNGTKKYDDMAAKDKVRYAGEKEVFDAMIAERKEQAQQDKVERFEQDKKEAMELAKTMSDAATVATNMDMDNMSVVSGLTAASAPIKKKKDPNAPKRAATAYNYFVKDNRGAIKASMPDDTNNAALLTEIGKQWKELEDKTPYTEQADADKQRYAGEIAAYNAGK